MPTLTDEVRFRRPPSLPGLELVEASYRRRAFPVHSHEEYVIGVVTAGAERLAVRGGQIVAGCGDLILIEPGEPHANQGADDDGFAYRVFYVPPAIVAGFGAIRFPSNVIPGGALGSKWAALHRRMMAATKSDSPDREFFGLLAAILDRAGSRIEVARPGERERVARARHYLDGRFAEPISLGRLAQVAGLSPFHLLRSFRDQVGITPGAYQTQLRVLEARRRLRAGAAIADIAVELGFADQSHLSRHFQRIIGTSPGRYAQQ